MDTERVMFSRGLERMIVKFTLFIRGLYNFIETFIMNTIKRFYYICINSGIEHIFSHSKKFSTKQINEYGGILRENSKKLEELIENKLLLDAYKMGIPEPKEVKKHREKHGYTVSHGPLSETARNSLEIKVLQRKRARREGFVTWTSLAIGFIGALTGLASVLSK